MKEDGESEMKRWLVPSHVLRVSSHPASSFPPVTSSPPRKWGQDVFRCAADLLYIPTTNARNRLTGYHPRRQRQDAATDAMIDINSNALAGSGTAEFNPTAEVLAALPKLVTQVLY